MTTFRDQEGILIAIEGIDGAGKTTQAQILGHALADFAPVLSKEPTNGKWGRKIRASANTGRLPPTEELAAFVADRKEHVETVIGPALAAGKIVILDRYFYSTIAYQGERGCDVNSLRQQVTEGVPIPDMVFLLDIDPRQSMARIGNRGETPNHFEQSESLGRVRVIFNKLAKDDDRIWKLDGGCGIQEIHRTIVSLLMDNRPSSR